MEGLQPPSVAVAVDWSGRREPRDQRRHIWLAEVRAGRVTRLEGGRTRGELVEHLVELARREPALAVGLDFAFAFPAWFAREHGARSGPDAWRLAVERGETWLEGCPPPFWGHALTRRPPPDPERPHFRKTECEFLPVAGHQPKSVFQIGGAGAVGTQSLRGMPFLLELAAAGFAIWPFDAPRLPLVIEIYPRLLTGPVVKSDAVARQCRLVARAEALNPEHFDRAARSEDAFDAALSALALWEHRERLLHASGHGEPPFDLEGRIWQPLREPFAR